MPDHTIKLDHDGLTLLRPITAVCGTAPGTVTRRATVTADVFGETYEAEFAIEPGQTVTLPSPVADDTGTWRKVEYPRTQEPDDVEPDSPLDSLAIPGESPSDTARRIRLELAALRAAVREANEQRDLAAVAASRARDGEEDARRELAALENRVDAMTRYAGATKETGTLLQRLDCIAVLASKAIGLAGESDSLEWLAVNGYPVGRHSDGRVSATYTDEDDEPDWCATWTEAARKLGMP